MILQYKLETTNDLLSSRAGLLTVAQMMDSLRLDERIDHHFPAPRSNRGYQPSVFIKTLMLMQHEGSFRLDDVRHIQEDDALCTVLGIDRFPQATTLGDWLRRMGAQPQIRDAWVKVNQALLQSALHRCKQVTLDIDATEIVADKADAAWTYNKNKGFMPMVGHIAEIGQVAAVDFRQGNVPPAQDNLGFIQQCQRSLPAGCTVKALRIDAAGYQTSIIKYCDENGIEYAIRAKSSAALREQIEAVKDSDWQPLEDKKGNAVIGEDTYRTSMCIGDYEKAFTLVIQRKAIQGQASLDLDSQENAAEISQDGYMYRAIATNRDELMAFYSFPAQHWQSIRTSNPIESAFGTIRHRTKRSKGCLSRDGMLHMMFKLGMCAQQNWRRQRGFNYLAKVITGVKFKDGIEVTESNQVAA